MRRLDLMLARLFIEAGREFRSLYWLDLASQMLNVSVRAFREGRDAPLGSRDIRAWR